MSESFYILWTLPARYREEKMKVLVLLSGGVDSSTCLALAKEKYGDAIDIIEYKYNKRENIARCKRMGVTNLPTLYINGQPKYVSIIPSHEEFYAEIEKYFK